MIVVLYILCFIVFNIQKWKKRKRKKEEEEEEGGGGITVKIMLYILNYILPAIEK
jgi:hypothetical protein